MEKSLKLKLRKFFINPYFAFYIKGDNSNDEFQDIFQVSVDNKNADFIDKELRSYFYQDISLKGEAYVIASGLNQKFPKFSKSN